MNKHQIHQHTLVIPSSLLGGGYNYILGNQEQNVLEELMQEFGTSIIRVNEEESNTRKIE